jgi:hypothetical protein
MRYSAHELCQPKHLNLLTIISMIFLAAMNALLESAELERIARSSEIFLRA